MRTRRAAGMGNPMRSNPAASDKARLATSSDLPTLGSPPTNRMPCGGSSPGSTRQGGVVDGCCTTKSWFLCAARRFSCRLGELIQLIDAGSCGRQNSDEDSAPCSGDVIAVGARHFLDDSMCPQQAELSADG